MTHKDTRVAIFSDLHLGVHQNSSYWHDTSMKWCDWFVIQLERENIKTVLFLGDYFHYRDEIAVNTLDIGKQLLSKLRNYTIIMIPGNHDCYYKDHSKVNSLSIFSGWPNIHVVEDSTVMQFGNKSAAFIPWGSEVSSKADYIFGHFELNTFKMNSSRVCDNGDDVFSILAKSNNIFSGHFHQRDERKYENGKVIYVGNPFETDFSDCNNGKGVYILDFATDNIKFIANDISSRHVKIPISKLGDGSILRQADINGNIIRLIIDERLTVENIEKAHSCIAAHKPAAMSTEYLVDKNAIDLKTDANYTVNGVSIENSMKEFIDILDTDNKDKIYEKCVSLYIANK